MVNNILLLPTLGRRITLQVKDDGDLDKGQRSTEVKCGKLVLWLPYLVTRTAETMVKESKVKERSNFTKIQT